MNFSRSCSVETLSNLTPSSKRKLCLNDWNANIFQAPQSNNSPTKLSDRFAYLMQNGNVRRIRQTFFDRFVKAALGREIGCVMVLLAEHNLKALSDLKHRTTFISAESLFTFIHILMKMLFEMMMLLFSQYFHKVNQILKTQQQHQHTFVCENEPDCHVNVQKSIRCCFIKRCRGRNETSLSSLCI